MPMFLATMFFRIIVQKVSYASKQLIKSQLCNHFGDNVHLHIHMAIASFYYLLGRRGEGQ